MMFGVFGRSRTMTAEMLRWKICWEAKVMRDWAVASKSPEYTLIRVLMSNSQRVQLECHDGIRSPKTIP